MIHHSFFVTQLCQGKALPSTLQPNTQNVQIIEPKVNFKVRPAEEPNMTSETNLPLVDRLSYVARRDHVVGDRDGKSRPRTRVKV